MAKRPTRKRKSTARRKVYSSKQRRKSPRSKMPRWLSWKKILLISLLAMAAYTLYLDITIRSQFEGKRWAIPARVYARPLELYVGLPMSMQRFMRELGMVGYRSAYRSTDPGTYSRQGNWVRIITRAFDFWDGHEPSRILELEITEGRIKVLKNLSADKTLSLVRLDPAFIGGIYPTHHEDRILVKLDNAPVLLANALIAVEDRNFYDHYGIDPRAIGRALLANLRAGSTVQGGSTLTQQLVKNFFLTNERTLWRKANEAVMAILLDWHYDKDEILQAYINEVYLGQEGKRSIHGFGLASQFYFDKPLDDLNLPQIAMLVALVRGPTYYDAYRHPKRLIKRRNMILNILVERHVISATEADRAKQFSLDVIHDRPSGITPYPAFMDLVRRQLRRDYQESDLTSEGLRIFTTLDPILQRDIEKVLKKRVAALDKQRRLNGKLQGAVVVTSTNNGEVLGLLGDHNPRYAGFNRALDAVRPIGSLIKPAVYLTALEQPERYSLSTPIDDARITLKGQDGNTWSPQNYDGKSHGTVPLYQALVHSYNQATVRLGLALGFEKIVNTIQRLGVKRDIPPYPSMLLGAVGMSPYDVTQMYQTLAAGGFYSPLRAIREVLTAEGEPLKRFPIQVEQTVNSAPVQVVNSALREVVRSGTARSVQAKLPKELHIAGKTGTTNDLRDSWFAGFTGQHLAVVWLGIDDNKPTGLTGSSGALTVWGDIIGGLYTQPLEFTPIEQVEYLWIDPETGLVGNEDCSGAVELAFIKGSAPETYAECAGGGSRK